jgi:hypothetical protein
MRENKETKLLEESKKSKADIQILDVPGWLKTKFQEDFTVIWSASFRVGIRCSEMTSGNWES